MRVALCTLLILCGFAAAGHADDKPRKRVQVVIPPLEQNGYTARFGIDENQIWDTPDVYGRKPAWARDNGDRPAGLTISRPLQW